jgi:DNA-3-methyladenine glycosylase II
MKETHLSFTSETLPSLCNKLARKDPDLKKIITAFGYPPFWKRPVSFATLVHIILEQQVSLASALSALNQLKKKLGRITPEKILSLTDAEMKACYVSRQKTVYLRSLAEAVLKKELQLSKLSALSDDEVRRQLIQIKGIGAWTADVFLMMVLHRCDCFPLGDVALVNSMKKEKGLTQHLSQEALEKIAESWKPYRTVAAFMLWHAYLSRRKKAA